MTGRILSTVEKNIGDETDALAALSVSDLNTNVNHEPRLLDIRVAERLGYDRPRKIREIIERNREELESYGAITMVERNSPHGGANSPHDGANARRRGAPGRTYWLNEAQTLLICMFSKTDRAALVRKEVIEVYMAYRHQDQPRPRFDINLSKYTLSLLDQLKREEDPVTREVIYGSFDRAMLEMGLQTPALQDIPRVTPPLNDILIPFWRAIHDLEAAGIGLNHAHDPALIALRLPEVRQEFRKSQVPVPVAGMLRDALKRCQSPRFIAVKAVSSKLARKTVKCWVFEGWNAPKAEG